MDLITGLWTDYKLYFIGGVVLAGVIYGAVKLMRRSQSQSSGDRSMNIQAGRDAKVDRARMD